MILRKMILWEVYVYIGKYVFSSCNERGTKKKFWVPMRNRTLDLRIPRSDALTTEPQRLHGERGLLRSSCDTRPVYFLDQQCTCLYNLYIYPFSKMFIFLNFTVYTYIQSRFYRSPEVILGKLNIYIYFFFARMSLVLSHWIQIIF